MLFIPRTNNTFQLVTISKGKFLNWVSFLFVVFVSLLFCSQSSSFFRFFRLCSWKSMQSIHSTHANRIVTYNFILCIRFDFRVVVSHYASIYRKMRSVNTMMEADYLSFFFPSFAVSHPFAIHSYTMNSWSLTH